MFIGAHPDDIELGAGGTLLKHLRNGDKVIYIILSRGEKGGDSKEREKELLEVINYLGISDYFLFNFPDTRFYEKLIEIKDVLEDLINKFKPNRIYTHSLSDSHQDHRTTAEAVKIAGRKVKQILSFWAPLTYNNFHPSYFVDISEFIEEKIKILEIFRSQNHKDFLKKETILGINKYHGFINGVNYAEGFEIIRFIEE